ncbi:hypothetical protein KFL_001780080 [Klebsormidium nitens]|uniref:CAAX prenyl protease 2/Lysostaphin resistance protein A-like domain-containing protein n=1 Tax=Klebsormidium nitens TaxID=105231 RepID=A0A1Y1I116_KLENI|nr:hypothetical protein KFL_001780080 [Klebsormidium nitens]|eukprot:GAQ84153.1 hypothetical protein KFL_001780080 [Klebsormidium nitens]
MESQAHRTIQSGSSSFSPFCQKHSSIFSETLSCQGTWLLKRSGRGTLDRGTRKGLYPQTPATNLGLKLPCKKSVTCQAGAENGEPGKELKPGRKSGVLAKGQWSAKPIIQDVRDIPEVKWQEFPSASRLGFTTVLYGGVYLASQVLCSTAKIDVWETFQLTPGVFVVGLAFALPLILASECMHHDYVVDRWQPAQAVREAEEDENADFYTGMTTTQLVLVTSMKAVAEELFYRAGVQGVIAHWLALGSKGFMATSTGISSVTGIVPPFGPFSEALAVVATACVAGLVHLNLSTPREPEVIIAAADADVFGGREDVKLMVEEWLQGRKLRRIYSPMVEIMLAIFLGFELLRVGNIAAPITTHAAYELWIVGASLLRCKLEKPVLKGSQLHRAPLRKDGT